MLTSITIILPLPDRGLSPNARSRTYHKKARLTKVARRVAWALSLQAISQTGEAMPWWKKARTTITAYFPTKTFADSDNLLASLKPSFDGICDAGVLIDDKELSHNPVTMMKDAKNPRVEILITALV